MNIHHENRLAEIFQSGMMFQRDKEIVLWGEAAPGTTVHAAFRREGCAENASPSLRGNSIADPGGRFLIRLPRQKAGEGYQLSVTFDSGNTGSVMLENICFGDLWLAGGQSNMEFFLKYDRDWKATRKLPRNPRIRMYNVPQRAFEGHTTHNKTGYGYWFDDSNDQALECFSAPAYSFARNLQPQIDVPVGIIGCNWGGSTASAWVPEEALRTPPLDLYLKEYEDAIPDITPEKLARDSLAAWAFEDSAQHGSDFEPLLYGRDRDWQLRYMETHAGDPVIPMGPYHFNRPGGLYHTMLSTLIPLSIKGVLWYQGESDAGDRAFMYDKLLTALIKCWRAQWHDDLPFLIVQLAPFGMWLDCDNQDYAVVREKQAFVAENVPDVYMAGIMDLGSYYDIHPKEKMEVGRRLALLARGHVYGEKNLLCDAPRAVSAILLENGQILIRFRHGDGLTIGYQPSDWNIRIGGQNFPPEQITAEGEHLILTLPDTAPEVKYPCHVSLGWADYANIHIKNRAGLSALPFQLVIEQNHQEVCNEKTSL